MKDFEKSEAKDRYRTGKLPFLPFREETFSLILCSHFLFLYHEPFDYRFHLDAIQELVRICRTGGEIRLYPLVGFQREPYPKLDQLMDILNQKGVSTELMPTDFRFLPGAEHVLRLQK